MPQFRDVRLGMIEPATSESFFERFDASAEGQISRISLGFNPVDLAVTKAEFSCRKNGKTCLGSRPQYGCTVRARFQAIPGTEVYGFDFSGYRGSGYSGEGWSSRSVFRTYERHDLVTYLVRDDSGPFVRSVLEDGAVTDE